MGVLCLSLVVAVVLLLGTGWWNGADENESARSEQALKRFLAAPNYRQVVLNSSDPELWQLSGYVDENSARLALQQYLDSSPGRFAPVEAGRDHLRIIDNQVVFAVEIPW